MAKPVELACERCGKLFTVPAWMVTKGRRFCSESCRKENPLTALLGKVEIQENGCWNYTGFVGHGGYGQIMVDGKKGSTHKIMWEVWNEEKVPEGLVVRHTCIGNPRCINPDHLTIGTQKQNIHDCIDQGRFPEPRTGETNGQHKLTEADVREIRRLRNPEDGLRPTSYQSLANQFGVSYTAVYFAANRIQWKHVE